MSATLRLAVTLPAALLGACATVPEVSVRYYPVAWEAKVQYIVTVGCANGDKAVIVPSVVITPSYFARGTHPYELRLKGLSGVFSGTNIAVDLTEDGRLRGINHTSTGQGDTIVSTLASIGLALTTTPATTSSAVPKDRTAQLCELVQKMSTGKSPVSVVYSETVTKPNQQVDLKPPKALEHLLGVLGTPKVIVSNATAQVSGPQYSAPPGSIDSMETADAILLKLQQTATVKLTVMAKADATSDKEDEVGNGTIVVPLDVPLYLPIPKPALFGKQGFVLALAESGAIVKVGYEAAGGASGALGALKTVTDQTTTAAAAARKRDQADLIYQDQRLTKCLDDAKECKQ